MRESSRKFVYAWIFIIILSPGFLLAEEFIISAQVLSDQTIRIDINPPPNAKAPELILYRSTAKLNGKDIDKIRYDFMKTQGLVPENLSIGGEIQIHGKHPRFGSIQRNWTWGCISLRNTDMDEIFSLSALKVGIPVIILGQEFSLEDAISLNAERPLDEIKSIQIELAKLGLYEGKIDGILGRQTQFAIGRYQKNQGLPINCVPDARTMGLLLN